MRLVGLAVGEKVRLITEREVSEMDCEMRIVTLVSKIEESGWCVRGENAKWWLFGASFALLVCLRVSRMRMPS